MGRHAALVLIGLVGFLFPARTAADDLIAAAKRGDLFAVHHYLRKDPGSLTAVDEFGYTALDWAAIRGRWEVFEDLIEAGAPVDTVGGDGGTPLHRACHNDRPDMVRLLLDNGADLTVRNQWGRTPLHVAVRRGCDLVAALLLARGADPDATTREGWTTLHVAYKAGHPRLIDLLIEAGASPDRKDDEGHRPADYAFERPEPIDVEPAELDAYVGRYGLGPQVTVKVWKEKNRLHMAEFAPDEIDPIGPDVFFCRREPWKVTFHRDENGAVDRIEIDFLRRTVKGRKLPEYQYVGARRCAQCHTGGDTGGQYISWMQGRHALAYWHLATDWARFLASRRDEYSDIREPIEEPRCRKCHVTGAQDPDTGLAESFRREEGVGCESCHGPGSAYIDPEVMADRDRFIRNGGIVPDEATCRQCHQDDRFHYDERLPKIAHPRPQTGAAGG